MQAILSFLSIFWAELWRFFRWLRDHVPIVPSFVPWWFPFFFSPGLGKRLQAVKEDYALLPNLWHYKNFLVTIFGYPPLLSAHPQAEIRLSLASLIDWFLIALLTLFSIPVIVLSFVPVLCCVYPWTVALASLWSYVYHHLFTYPRPAPQRVTDEKWFYVNGMNNTSHMGRMAASYLSELLKRDVELIHNPTLGFFMDLLECVFSRTFQETMLPDEWTYEKVKRKLLNNNIQHVGLIGHSQGCLIVAKVLQLLRKDFKTNAISANQLAKLEVYLFASPSIKVPALPGVHIEYFANQNDLVVHLGTSLANPATFRKPDNGHQLVQHYLLSRRNFVNAGNSKLLTMMS